MPEIRLSALEKEASPDHSYLRAKQEPQTQPAVTAGETSKTHKTTTGALRCFLRFCFSDGGAQSAEDARDALEDICSAAESVVYGLAFYRGMGPESNDYGELSERGKETLRSVKKNNLVKPIEDSHDQVFDYFV
ncbi:hypothetical protein DNTS_024903 [Danionella cerebrum]|uniref:Uncharacterized protein n=1 Tax=Danionella cerebrum TaxID=2873325 RepID=A0A553QS91_9TELE|nr:hypothetical protein DNTS_024903 [Danionella translucida]